MNNTRVLYFSSIFDAIEFQELRYRKRNSCIGELSLMLDVWAIENHVHQSKQRLWHSILLELCLNDPSNENFFSNISLRTTCAARAKCIASLSWSQAFLIAVEISSSNERITSLPCEHAFRSGITDISLFFSLDVCIRFSVVTPSCFSNGLCTSVPNPLS